MIYLILGPLFWLSVFVAILTGFTTPIEAFGLGATISLPVLFKKPTRDWPVLKLAFGGWVTATFILLAITGLLSPFLSDAFVCDALKYDSFKACSLWVLKEHLFYILLFAGLVLWVLIIRFLSVPKVKMWKILLCSPLTVALTADLGFRLLILTWVEQG